MNLRQVALAGTRTHAADGDTGCIVCRSQLGPAIVLSAVSYGNERHIVARLCLPCVGKAVEGATGWRVMRAWSQWLDSSLRSWEARGLRSPEGNK